jgi:hypothetical protein
MLHMFAMVFKCFQVVFFSGVFATHILSVSYVFFCMLQLLHSDVLKVDRAGYARWEAAGGAGYVRGGAGPLLVRSLVSPTRWYVRSLAKRVPSDASVPDWTSER